MVGLDTPGPASATGVLSARGSTNFVHAEWAGYDIRAGSRRSLGKPVTYLNDGNAAALWGHFAIFGAGSDETSVSAIIGTGLGGGVIIERQRGQGPEGLRRRTGPRAAPLPEHSRHRRHDPDMQLRPHRRPGIALLAHRHRADVSAVFPAHGIRATSWAKIGDLRKAAKLVRGLAENGDPMCKEIFRVQAHALGLFFDEMINTFDPDALIVGGGALETGEDFQQWFIGEIRPGMPRSARSRSIFRSTSCPTAIRPARAARPSKRWSSPATAG